MKLEQRQWTNANGWTPSRTPLKDTAQLVFVFGGTAILSDRKRLQELRACYPKARLFGCSTAGEICGTQVADDSVVMTAVEFDTSHVALAQTNIVDCASSRDAGERVAKALDPKGLTHAIVLSDGQRVNGSELVLGIMAHLPRGRGGRGAGEW